MLHRTSMNQSVYLTNQLVMIICVYFTAYTAISGALTAGQVLAFLVLISRVLKIRLLAVNTWGNFQQGLGAGERIFALFKPSGEGKSGQQEKKKEQEQGEQREQGQQEETGQVVGGDVAAMHADVRTEVEPEERQGQKQGGLAQELEQAGQGQVKQMLPERELAEQEQVKQGLMEQGEVGQEQLKELLEEEQSGAGGSLAVASRVGVRRRRSGDCLEGGFGVAGTGRRGIYSSARPGKYDREQGRVYCRSRLSGAGKSTLVRLCCGLIPSTAGEAKILGSHLEEQPLGNEALRHISYVPQTPYLFTGTVKENIMLGLEGASEEEAIWASKAACAHAFIEKMNGGYDAVVGERGETLSGGQRQRITLARALIRRPKLLILDEATSSLDTLTESKVMGSIMQALPGITIISVSHRESAIQYADRIIAMKRGRIVEEGTHDELIQLGGVYAALFANHKGQPSVC